MTLAFLPTADNGRDGERRPASPDPPAPMRHGVLTMYHIIKFILAMIGMMCGAFLAGAWFVAEVVR